jgi:helicase
MHIKDLARWEFPEDLINAWQKDGIETLLPIQEQAIKRHRLFDGGNMIVSAPTSSGKTFVGEMAAVYNGLKGKRAVYLVPLKALAEEKFQNFKKLYEPYDLKIVISTRDHKEFDKDIENGNFEIAIIVYEKFFSLLNSSAKFLDQIGLIVIDELQLISDPSRGSNLELILTKLKLLKNTFQLIGLSAVLGKDSGIDRWLDINLLQYSRRPVELRSGYLYDGTFYYQTYNTREGGEEVLLPNPPEGKIAIVIAAVSRLAKSGEQSLIFLMDKASTRRVAKEIARNSELPSADEALEELSHLEATISNEELAQVLSSGVAFHHADLTIEERLLVEHHFRKGNIRVLVSTTTLAMGVNLPTRNVFIELRKWHTEPGERQPIQIDLPKSDFENMGGRAGRFQLEDEFGRAIAVVTRKVERDQFKHKYHYGELEGITPNLWRDSMATTVLGIVALGGCRKIEEVRSFLRNTLTWYLHRKDGVELDKLNEQLERGISDCLQVKVLHQTDRDELFLTDLGGTVAASGVRVETAGMIVKWLDKRYDSPISATEAILAAVITPDGQEAYLNMSTPEYSNKGYFYEHTAHELAGDVLQIVFRPMMKYQMDNYQTIKAYKIALLITDYISSLSNRELERNYSTFFGAIKRVSEHISWLLSSAAGIAKTLGYSSTWVKALDNLSIQVQYGLTSKGVFLAQMRIPRLGRERISAMVYEGVECLDHVIEAGEEFIGELTTIPVAKELFKRIRLMRENSGAESSEEPVKDSVRNDIIQHDIQGNVVVAVNNGTINVGSNAGSEQTQSEKDIDDYSNLSSPEWRKAVKRLIEELSPQQMEDLHEEIRKVHHNKLRPGLRDAKKCTTVKEFKIILGEFRDVYNEINSCLTDNFNTLILPDYKDDLNIIEQETKSLDKAKSSLESLGSTILKKLTRLLNLVEDFNISPEEILEEAIESCNGELVDVTLDCLALQSVEDRQASFYHKAEMIDAFKNILRNAAEAKNGNGDHVIAFSSVLSGGYTALKIMDNGAGIPQEVAGRIFEKGFSTKSSDGFGLAHAKKVIEAHGGSLVLVSGEKEGTAFEVRL